MSKLEDFVKVEKDKYGTIFSDIQFSINNVSEFVSEKNLKGRKYYTRIPVLKKYMELLNSVQLEKKEKGFFSFLDSDKYIDILNDYKKDNKEAFNQLECCAKCQCLNCTRECNFDSCKRCTAGSKIAFCDHTRANVSMETRTLNLLNENTGEDDLYNVLAIVQDIEKDKRYIFIENTRTREKYILYYYPGISEDTYEEITDEDDFNFAAETYDNLGIS